MTSRDRLPKQPHRIPKDNDAQQTFPKINYRLMEMKAQKYKP